MDPYSVRHIDIDWENFSSTDLIETVTKNACIISKFQAILIRDLN